MSQPARSVQLAVIGAAHGLKGEIRVKSFTEDPMALARYGALHDASGRRFEIAGLRRQGEMLIVRFAGISDRAAADALNGTALFVDRAALPETDEEDAFYHADLIGLRAEDTAGMVVGTVKAIHDFKAGDIMELALADGGTAMIPFTKAAVPLVELMKGRIVIEPRAAGLAEDGAEDAP